ncbi:unnamed protein product [Meloidogyne enterolobii]|uniref:Uncharacterized protein n=1 Tax=Meloidogyne enterolobii TaxID=390850 RepID=A0ACB0Y7R3_MELEN
MDNRYQFFWQVFHPPKCLVYQHSLLNIPVLDLLDQHHFQLTGILLLQKPRPLPLQLPPHS